MQPFTTHTGIAAPLLRDNVDTDSIIPSREMSRVSRRGLGRSLFAGWRYCEAGAYDPNPGFILNLPRYKNASILLAGSNFGCGSSREHAVWALADFGIRAVLAESFGAIFESNCWRNGLLPLKLDRATIQSIADASQDKPLTIDLEHSELRMAGVGQWGFTVPERLRRNLLAGADEIDQTLNYRESIDLAIQRRAAIMPWAQLTRRSP
ncbi:MAG: 3-isopropylmalate dehydratase small subunit [Pseudomonadota bacterium]